MLDDVVALAILANVIAGAAGFLWRRRRAERRPSLNLEHARQLLDENEEMDEILDRIGANEPPRRGRLRS